MRGICPGNSVTSLHWQYPALMRGDRSRQSRPKKAFLSEVRARQSTKVTLPAIYMDGLVDCYSFFEGIETILHVDYR
jgi:hypothetical protein